MVLLTIRSSESLHKKFKVDSLVRWLYWSLFTYFCLSDCGLLVELQEPDTLKPKIRQAFLDMDKELRDDPKVRSGEDHSGTTAVTCLLTPQNMICANCGDSRALLIRNEEQMPLSYDHKPYNVCPR